MWTPWIPRAGRVRRVGVIAIGSIATMLVAVTTASAGPNPGEESTAEAVDAIVEARDRANAAADAFFEAEAEFEGLEVDRDRLRVETEELARTVAELRSAIEALAVARFVSSGASGIPVLTGVRRPTEQIHGDVLARVVADTGENTLDDYDEARAALVRAQDELVETERRLARQRDIAAQLQASAEAEVERLRAVESQRLVDEAVRIALDARAREELRLAAELERRDAEARRSAADAALWSVAATSSGQNSGNRGVSGGGAGGRTGGGGLGSDPRSGGEGYVDAIVCPVQGVSAYGDTWGAPRSGGRRHQGTDLLAPTGTPLQAVVSGTVVHAENELGGTTLSLLGDNGNRYYYAHLSRYEGFPGRVEQGQVIGYVGDSGNATGIPHLHFEIRPGGGVPVNPFRSVRAAGC